MKLLIILIPLALCACAHPSTLENFNEAHERNPHQSQTVVWLVH
jgi:hypothetical protein